MGQAGHGDKGMAEHIAGVLAPKVPKDDAHAQRCAGLAALAGIGFPTRKTELYKYTPLQDSIMTLLSTGVLAAPVALPPPPASVECTALPALSTSGTKAPIAGVFGSSPLAETDPWVLLNTALYTGYAVTIPANTRPEPWVLTLPECEGVSNQRLAIYVGEDSHFTLIQALTPQTASSCTNWVIEIHCAARSVCHVVKLQSPQGLCVDHTFIAQEAQAQAHVYTLSSGTGTVRNNLYVRLQGDGGHNALHGVLLGAANAHLDHHTKVEHYHPNTESHQTYRSVLQGRSCGVFNGIIYMHPGAVQTQAYQSSKSVLLNAGTKMHAKPQLEIHADDVRCSHGCTTGRLDEQALFYLQSRGLERTAATTLLSAAFVAEALSDMPAHVAAVVEPWVKHNYRSAPKIRRKASHVEAIGHALWKWRLLRSEAYIFLSYDALLPTI